MATITFTASAATPAIAESAGVTLADADLVTIVENALLSPYQDEQNLDGVEKIKRFVLAQKVHDASRTNNQPALTADDLLDLHVLLATDTWFDEVVALVRHTTPE